MKTNKLLQTVALGLGLSMALSIPAVGAELTDIPVAIITAPILIPMGIIDKIKEKKAEKEQKEWSRKYKKQDEQYKLAHIQELTSFLQRGCKFEDLASPRFAKVLRSAQLNMGDFASDQKVLIDYYSSDDSTSSVGVDGIVIEEKFGEVDNIPAQDSRKIAVKKMKEMAVKYTNSAHVLRDRIYLARDLTQLSNDEQQLAVNFACDQAQVELSTWYFREVLEGRASAKVKMNTEQDSRSRNSQQRTESVR